MGSRVSFRLGPVAAVARCAWRHSLSRRSCSMPVNKICCNVPGGTSTRSFWLARRSSITRCGGRVQPQRRRGHHIGNPPRGRGYCLGNPPRGGCSHFRLAPNERQGGRYGFRGRYGRVDVKKTPVRGILGRHSIIRATRERADCTAAAHRRRSAQKSGRTRRDYRCVCSRRATG